MFTLSLVDLNSFCVLFYGYAYHRDLPGLTHSCPTRRSSDLSVAVFAEADRHALHVKRADEAHFIGEDPLAGYLNPRKLVNLAVETGCDALHPGYGFRSEEHTSELQSLMRISYAVLCLKKKIIQ